MLTLAVNVLADEFVLLTFPSLFSRPYSARQATIHYCVVRRLYHKGQKDNQKCILCLASARAFPLDPLAPRGHVTYQAVTLLSDNADLEPDPRAAALAG